MSVFVGLDCGGSSSRVLAVDFDGKIVFQGQSGAANLASTPEARLRRNLGHATDGCPHADYVCGCFAGLVSPELRQRGEDHLRQLFPRAKVRAEPDYTAALYASPQGTDLCVIAGTGSLVCSRTIQSIVKSGGRGYLLGDQGSGYQYGRDALIAFLDAPRKASEDLRKLVLDVFETTEEGPIIARIYASATPATLVGRFSKALAHDAKAGEAYALASIDRHTRALAEVVQRHVATHHADSTQLGISLAGGVWKSSQITRDAFAEHLTALMPDRAIELHRVTRPPLAGAVELAKEMSHGNRN